MTPDIREDRKVERSASLLVRVIQSIGAIIVTALVFWFLFGVPAYLLFGIFFR